MEGGGILAVLQSEVLKVTKRKVIGGEGEGQHGSVTANENLPGPNGIYEEVPRPF